MDPIQILPEGTIVYRTYTPDREGYWYSFSKYVPRGYCQGQPCEIGTYRLKKDLNVLLVSPLTMSSIGEWDKIIWSMSYTKKEEMKARFIEVRDLLGASLTNEQLDILSQFPWRSSSDLEDEKIVRELCTKNLDGIVFEDNMTSGGEYFVLDHAADSLYELLQKAWVKYTLGEPNWHDEVSVCDPSNLELVSVKSENFEEIFEERTRHFESKGYEDPENLAYLDLKTEHIKGLAYKPRTKALEQSVAKIQNEDVREYFESILFNFERNKELIARIPKFNPEIQFISDLHIEKWGLIQVEPSASILIVGGDIAPVVNPLYEEQIAYFSAHWEHVLVVLGNHEYYGSSIEGTEQTCREMFAKYPNVKLLQKDYIEIRDRIFVGCTLWSNIGNGRIYHEQIRKIMKDFTVIDNFSPPDWQALFTDQKNWLEKTLKSLDSNGKQVVVITHHAPLYNESSPPEFRGSAATPAFGTTMTEVFPWVDIWLFGHTHYNIEKQKVVKGHTTFILSNYCFEGECGSLTI